MLVLGVAVGAAVEEGVSADGGVEGKGKNKDKVEGAELEDESVYREKGSWSLEGLIDKGLKGDYGCSVGGLYELVIRVLQWMWGIIFSL